jgi:osmoprotectant transport system ATP-binding protein
MSRQDTFGLQWEHGFPNTRFRGSMRMIRLEDVSKSFDGRPALRSFSLDIQDGKTTVLLGPSGCGKSTLIRIVAGLVRPDTGVISIDGERLSEQNVLDLRRRIGYVIQEGGLFPHLTARQNVGIMAKHLGWDRCRIDAAVGRLCRLAKFPPDSLDRFPRQLSGGQNQRVGLMRALMLDPGILLLDEPLGSLDPLIRFDLQRDLRGLFRTLGKTVILVTHDVGEAAFLGELIVVIREGGIVQQGTIRDLVERPADSFVSQFMRAQLIRLDSLKEIEE